ncbi:MAG: hypothetical protein AMJ88_09915 [Anaerolineae bacterium SM23_ 63]|nr:MAG: hypothetical protein AMJ88_09915 [Anaerolineae bacterium SM23_ 63]
MINMKESSLLDRIRLELDQAHLYRTRGKEGRARVCARRAAGWAVAVFRQERSGAETHPNAYHQLRWFRKLEDMPIELRKAANRLTTHVTPSHDLPYHEDPLEDAEMIVHALLNELKCG